jgi:hypothetical protein
MNEVFISALVERIKVEQMKLGQVPIPYREVIEEKLRDEEEEVAIDD